MAMIRAKSQNIVKGAKKRAYINKAARKIDNPKMEGCLLYTSPSPRD